jgi:hypothetical protein
MQHALQTREKSLLHSLPRHAIDSQIAATRAVGMHDKLRRGYPGMETVSACLTLPRHQPRRAQQAVRNPATPGAPTIRTLAGWADQALHSYDDQSPENNQFEAGTQPLRGGRPVPGGYEQIRPYPL